MSNKDGNNYGVYRKFLKTIQFEALILKIPEEELEDKLTYFVGEKGQITKSLFEDFIIATCVANVNQLLFHLNQQVSNPPELIKVRDELLNHIFKVNPLLVPDNLVININHVVKLKTGKRCKKGETLLIKNKSWGTSYYDDLANVSEALEKRLKQGTVENQNDTPKKDIEELNYVIVKKWWKRVNKYIEIKQYSEEDVEHILKQRCFHNRISFETFIVSVCVNEFEELFSMLDELGIPKNVAPPILMHELYELCRSGNEFLTFKRAQELVGEAEEEDETNHNPFGTSKASNSTMNKLKQKNTKKKLFKNVPKEDILNLGKNMKVFLIGQDEAVDTITDAIQRASVGLKDPFKPIGSFLLAGSTGVGKTLATKVLADELIKGSRDNILTIDCSEYTADHEYSKLIGAPAGYVGHEHGGMLTNAMQKNPFTVVVFDEVEKASYKVHQLLLQILEEGRLTDGKGKAVPFKNAVIVMTSNVGVRELLEVQKTIGFGDVSVLTEEKKNKALNDALKKKFKPEFLNRIDAIVNFRNLTKKDYMRIIDIELYKLNDNLKNNDSPYQGVELKFDIKTRSYVYKHGINKEYGARPLKRYIEKNISTPLARMLLREEIEKDSLIKITIKKNKIHFEKEKKMSCPPFYISNGYNKMVSNVLGEDK